MKQHREPNRTAAREWHGRDGNRPLRIGLLRPEPDLLTRSLWSGTPEGLAHGFANCGADVVPIAARLPLGVHQAVAGLARLGGKRGAVADRTLIRQRSRDWALSRALVAAVPLDGIVAMGTEMYDLAAIRPRDTRVCTYDDATLRQMWRHPDSDIRRSGFPEREVLRWFDRQATSSRAADVCCASTRWAARSLVEDYQVPVSRVRVIGMGHRPRHHLADTTRDWSPPRYLFIGVDWMRKNGPAVLQAFEEVRRTVPDASLDVVGQHPLLDQPGVTGHGYLRREAPADQARLDEILARATAFVLPSRFDPSPIAYLEAGSAGLPVIATTEGGAGELLGSAAITVHPSDHFALVAAMLRLAEPSTARQMGAEAARRAADSRWSDVAQRLVRALGLDNPQSRR